MFFINHTELGNEFTALLEIEGPLNSENSSDLDSYVKKMVNNRIKFILIDCRNITFLSSEGIGITLLIQKMISSKNGYVVFYNFSEEIINLLKLLGFDKVFTIAGSKDEAVAIIDRQIEMRGKDSTDALSSFDEKTESTSQVKFTAASSAEIDSNDSETASPEETTMNIIEEPVPVFNPFFIKCIKCGTPIKISEPGEYICPECRSEFEVPEEGKAIFRDQASTDRSEYHT